MSPKQLLTDPGTIVVFTYAPVGLGHLRVTNALYEGLPKGVKTVLIGSSEKLTEATYKFVSTHVITRRIMEWFQSGWPQGVYTHLYRWQLRTTSSDMKAKIEEIFKQQIEIPKRMIIIATHFGFAHQIAAVKETLERKMGVKIYLMVQVTDDSPQYIWYVPGADVIYVPSKKTMLELRKYAMRACLQHVKFEVLPYPVSPILGEKLPTHHYESRKEQLSKAATVPINFCLPVSGAAVGMEFFHHLIPQLQSRYSRFNFHIICKEAPFTKKFLQDVRKFPNIHIHTSKHSREIVDMYDDVYKKNVIALEITKPSEQAFKALCDFDMVGGSLLLFAHPVGRQERDNLDFLRRHGLIFDVKMTEKMWGMAARGG
ncbi:MAG: hypothetical protein KatS3mg101_0689 [Patescibacteria group bacterium]|nr:MAG: hypothetical protein KatS3mg101_0689 [Patescibacteria group bacterium]